MPNVVMLIVMIIVIGLVSSLETRINVVQKIVFYQRNVCSGASYPISNIRLQHSYFLQSFLIGFVVGLTAG